jgi:ABC-type dipeptide/oligopeptide/nickel transport system permease component
MKHLIYITAIFLILGIWLTSCRTQQLTSNAETKYDSIVIEKLIPYALPEDSAKIRALLECDENGKVVLRWFDEEHTKSVKLQFKLDSLGNLLANFETARDTVYLPVKETTVGKKAMTQSIVTREVEKKLNWWQKLFLWTGVITWIVGIVILVYWSNKKKNSLSLLLKFIKKRFWLML